MKGLDSRKSRNKLKAHDSALHVWVEGHGGGHIWVEDTR